MPPPGSAKRNHRAGKLSYKEKRELDALPAKIEALEAEQSELHVRMGDAEFYRQPGSKITAALERLKALRNELEECYARWQSLESQVSPGGT